MLDECEFGYRGCTKEGDVDIDPYILDIYGEIALVIICSYCYNCLVEEI